MIPTHLAHALDLIGVRTTQGEMTMRVEVNICGPTRDTGIKVTTSPNAGEVCVWIGGTMTSVKASDLIEAAKRAVLEPK